MNRHDKKMSTTSTQINTQQGSFDVVKYIHHFEGLPDACESVEEVGRCVAPVIQHLVEGKYVVIDAVVRKVCIFNAAKGHGTLSLYQLLRGQHLQHTHAFKMLMTPCEVGAAKTFCHLQKNKLPSMC